MAAVLPVLVLVEVLVQTMTYNHDVACFVDINRLCYLINTVNCGLQKYPPGGSAIYQEK